MKKLLAALKNAPRRTGVLAMLAAVIAIPAVMYAWGPDRPTFTYKNPADYVTFNSITDNPTHGDERNFVQIRNFTDGGNFAEEVKLTPGKEYEVYAYYHNNASSSFNSAAHNFKGIAKDVKMSTEMPSTVKAGEKARITSTISSSNAKPVQVWDEAYGTADGTYQLSYVYDSAVIHSKGAVNGQKLSDNLYTTGAPLGYDKLDGTLPGCNEFAGYVTYRFKVNQPNFEVTKDVSPKGKNTYSDKLATTPSSEVEYKIMYKNTGTVQQDNVVIRDQLPAGVNYVANSTQISNSKTGNKWEPVKEETVAQRGINIGSYAPNGGAYVKFTARVVDNDKLAKCGENTLVNNATAETSNGSKSDTATITVTKKCEVPPVKIQVCELATKKIITIDEKNFDSKKHSKNLDDCKEVVVKIQVCELATKKVITINEKDFDAKKHSKNLNDCKPPVVIKIQVCELATKKIITIDEKTFDSKKHSKDLKDCDVVTKMQVCDLATKKVISINEKDFDAKKHSKNLDDCKPPVMIEVCELATKKVISIDEKTFDTTKHSKDLNDCTEVPPVTPPVETCAIPGKEHLPKDSKDCVETPAELPTTGMGDVMPVIGAGSLIAAIGYYAASRRLL